jgi:hypothetical protein
MNTSRSAWARIISHSRYKSTLCRGDVFYNLPKSNKICKKCIKIIFFVKMMPSTENADYRKVALEFTKALSGRKYSTAYAMTSQEYRKGTDKDQLQTAFETIVPTDWGKADP